jgi:hypothetical protein
MVRDEAGELRHELRAEPPNEVGLDPVLERDQSQLLERHDRNRSRSSSPGSTRRM